jgi:DNA polymerase III subunit delta'
MPLTADEAYDLLVQSRDRGRFAQAYLLTGAPGAGKRRLLERLACLLLHTAEGDPLKHPDVHCLEPQMKSRVIGIEAMQDLLGELHMRSLLGGPKLAIIRDADRMNTSSANALLRTLEEPPGKTHFFLLSTQPEQLLETILSRCIEVPLRSPEGRALTSRQQALLQALDTASLTGDLAEVFQLVRKFTTLLAEIKAEIEQETEASFKKEEVVLKQVGARKDAIDDRESFFKALTESRYRAERESLVAVVEQWFADALRQQHGAPAIDFEDSRETTAAMAARFAPAELLRRLSALSELRENFGRTVQEQLAIECAFLKAFAAA